MKIKRLIANNISELSLEIGDDFSYGIAGLSGSGKSTLCSVVANEAIKRLATLLPKSEYRFLFGEKLNSNFSAQEIEQLPMVYYLGKSSLVSSPRSTIGTHTGIFKEIRKCFAEEYDKTLEFFSFNTSIMWCPECKGRGTTMGKECKLCNGTRYNKDINNYTIPFGQKKIDITQINDMSMEELFLNCESLKISNSKKQIIKNMIDLKVGYLSLGRIVGTLSGGEGVRVLLSEFMEECRNSLIIIDEISIGLDHNTLIDVLDRISSLGKNNQIWLIDHSDTVLNSTQKQIFFGPGSGKYGGNIVDISPRPKPVDRQITEDESKDFFTFQNLKKRNIDISSLQIPKNRIVAITGESGCGKSTLVKECIVPAMQKEYKKVACEVIGQDRNQSITSKSTISSFLDIKKRLEKFDKELQEKELGEIIDLFRKDESVYRKIKWLVDLGLDYISLNRKIQTLSTGEFQCVHLVSKLTEHSDNEMLLIFDEPSKGLSQNILNLLMSTMQNIIQETKATILIIEHNEFMLKNSDYIIDFGKRTDGVVASLEVCPNKIWQEKRFKTFVPYSKHLKSAIPKSMIGIERIEEAVDGQFLMYEHALKGVLKRISGTAQWIYGDYETENTFPVFSIDLEKQIFSKKTFLFEIAGIVNTLIGISNTQDVESFDFYSKENLCECCKGTGQIDVFDFEKTIKNENKDFWNGLLHDEIMLALKKYNYSKFKFLFKEIKKAIGISIDKPYASMNDKEKNILLYGYWNESFYDPTKKTHRKWYGLIKLIEKYMRSSSSVLKKSLVDSRKSIICPICNGSLLNHNERLDIFGKDIRELIVSSIRDNSDIFCKIPQIAEVTKILGTQVCLNQDLSELPLIQQVQLKILDIKYAHLYCYTIAIKNSAPFERYILEDLERISETNKIVLLNYEGITLTKNDILLQYEKEKKIKGGSYVYELFGFKKIITEINKIRKLLPCPYCKGQKVLKEESIFDGVDVTETPCLACKQTGISQKGLQQKIENLSVNEWINSGLEKIEKNAPISLCDISSVAKINDLNKKQIVDLVAYIGGKKC